MTIDRSRLSTRLIIGLLPLACTAVATRTAAQTPVWAMTGGGGLAVIGGRPGGSLALGPRLARGRLVLLAQGELGLVRGGSGDEYSWTMQSDGGRECRDRGGVPVDDLLCLDLVPRAAALGDASVVLWLDDTVGMLLGAGYRLGDASTAFGSLTFMGTQARGGGPWHVRLVASKRYVQIHGGIIFPL